MKLSLCLLASLLSSSVGASVDTGSHHGAGDPKAEFTKRSLKRKEHKNRLLQSDLEDDKMAQCDQALMECLPLENCEQCFRILYDDLIDWGTVSPDTECPRVMDTLFNKGYCGKLQADERAAKSFCLAFHACAIIDEPYADDDASDDIFYDGNSRERLDCDNLTKCEWSGMHMSFVGDGVCNQFDCYNTEICGWDGGDCCPDTCSVDDKNYVTCGMDGYVCRDPTSSDCDSYFTSACPNDDNFMDDDAQEVITCNFDEAVYRVIMYDSFGDGWDATTMTITPSERPNAIVFNGALETGSQGTSLICLSKNPTCYNIQVTGGAWGNEVSWEVKPLTEGHPALAGGAAPMNCVFSVAGSACENTCTGKPNVHPNVDPEYKEFKDMYNCIEDFCFIQIDTCEQDLTCSTCMAEDAPEFCYGNEQFVALIDCTMCRCTDRKESTFCKEKLNPTKPPPDPSRDTKPKTGARSCSPSEVMDGSDALLTFGSCTDFDEVGMMVTNFDQDHFGLLDTFESCAHNFQNDINHGGHTALNCMQILVNAMNYAVNDDAWDGDDVPVEAIAELASLIYHDAQNFCDCTMAASETCPMCDKFVHFKTLLYESLDACQSLDEIDCAAWSEFYMPCKNNMGNAFSSIDFSSPEQCAYIANGCGGAGPFPAFRRLDCEKEVSATAWDFYKIYSRGCHKEDDGKLKPTPSSSQTNTNVIPVRPSSNYRPVTPSTQKPTTNSIWTTPSPTPQPTPKKYVPWDDRGGSKPIPIVPNRWTDDEYSSGGDSEQKKKSHFFRNFVFFCLLASGCYWVYKNRSESFNFVHQYTMNRNRNYASGESGMYGGHYTGLSSMEGSTSFEPPSLPPTPSAIDGNFT